MTNGQRIKLYGFGFLLGLLILSVILKGRGCSGPNELKIGELSHQYMELSDKAKCKLTCLGLTEATFKAALNKCRVNYDKSEVRITPCGKYFIEGLTSYDAEIKFSVVIEDCDTTSKVNDINLDKNIVCDCK